MTNKSSKGRVNKSISQRKSLVMTGGPRKSFQKIVKSSEKKTAAKPSTTPITIAVIPFHDNVGNSFSEFVDSLMVVSNSTLTSSCQIRSGHFHGRSAKHQVKLVVPLERTRLDVIVDIAKSADVLLCVFPADAQHDNSAFDELGYKTLSALRLQGLPPLVVGTVVREGSKLGMKTVGRFFSSEFTTDSKSAKFVVPSANVHDISGIAKQVMTVVSAAATGAVACRQRGYMLIEGMEVDEESKLIKVRGTARGTGFSLSHAVNMTGIPVPFRIARIEFIGGDAMTDASIVPTDEQIRDVVDQMEPLRPEELQDQPWVSDEEIAMATQQRMRKVAVPAGAGTDMEIAWLAEDEEPEEDIVDDNCDENLISGMFDWDKIDTTEEKPALFEMRDRSEMQFPDEVDTPENVPARERFQKYRGLKSMRNGNWDPYEELPAEFSQIHEFEDVGHATKLNFTELAENGKSCKNVECVLWLEPRTDFLQVAELVKSTSPLVLSSIGRFENKVTVVHCRVTLVDPTELPLISKEPVVVQIGFRRFEVRPIYSEIPKYSSSTGSLPIRKMLRDTGRDRGNDTTTSSSVLMSFYAPAVLGSAPVLVLKNGQLAAWGSLVGNAPNKPVIVKRITLTGYPYRVHKSKSVIRYMFFNPVDVDWFKPVELLTRKGLRGHISESLGTHGYMKCNFNGQLTSDDVICMHLYKRAFPKFHKAAWSVSE
jgi:pre-rRNA-processing protein TSR1